MSSPSSVGGELEKRGEWQMVFLCAGGIVSLESHFFTPRVGDFSEWGEQDTRVKEWLTHYFIEMETKAWEREMALKARARI